MTSEHAKWGGYPDETTNLLRANDPDGLSVGQKDCTLTPGTCHAGAVLAIVL
jgi:hypothetical protein